jgi:thymidylate synthase
MAGIPVLTAEGDGIAEAWENALMLLHHSGCTIKMAGEASAAALCKDATMIVTIHDPASEPMIHRDFAGGFESLQEYVMELCDGIKDHCICDPNDLTDDPNDHRPIFTDHQRLFCHQSPNVPPVDQIEQICNLLTESPTTRCANAITWNVWEDSGRVDSPRLQSVWCRINREEDRFLLNMNVRFRAVNAYKEAFLYWFALERLQAKIAARIHKLSGVSIELGRCCHTIDSFYIPGPELSEFATRFIRAMHERTFEQRTMRYETIREVMEATRPAILEKSRRLGRKSF